MVDPTGATKNWPNLIRVKNFWQGYITTPHSPNTIFHEPTHVLFYSWDWNGLIYMLTRIGLTINFCLILLLCRWAGINFCPPGPGIGGLCVQKWWQTFRYLSWATFDKSTIFKNYSFSLWPLSLGRGPENGAHMFWIKKAMQLYWLFCTHSASSLDLGSRNKTAHFIKNNKVTSSGQFW